VLVDGDWGAAEWVWREVRYVTGRVHEAEDAVVFQVCDGLLVYWREYFDVGSMG
jgi:limonene-1,2-epoxide hydrolase